MRNEFLSPFTQKLQNLDLDLLYRQLNEKGYFDIENALNDDNETSIDDRQHFVHHNTRGTTEFVSTTRSAIAAAAAAAAAALASPIGDVFQVQRSVPTHDAIE
jgi:hypothetical protein